MYPLLIGIAWGLGFILFQYFIKIENLNFPNPKTFAIYIFILSWLGGKLLFIITARNYLEADILVSSSLWLGGGFVFYGGFILGLIGSIIYFNYYKIKINDLSFMPIIVSLGHGIGRIGCFFAGCCYGTHCDLPWSINLHGTHRHPVQLYESILLFILSFTLYKLWITGLRTKLITVYIVAYGIIRFILEFFRGDKIRGEIFYFSTSQWISISIVLLCTCFFLVMKKLCRSK